MKDDTREIGPVYVTKYALTSGVVIYSAGTVSASYPTMVTVKTDDSWRINFHRDDWHTDPQTAIARVQAMKIAKNRSLVKQMASLNEKAELACSKIRKKAFGGAA